MPSFTKKPTPDLAIDALRIVAICTVVLIHTSVKVLQATNNDVVGFASTLFLNQAARFAVPLFFLISGYVLELNYHGSFNLLNYFKKRLTKLIVPLFIWSSIYYYFIYPTNPDPFWLALLSGNASYQLYFIPTIIIFYFLFPLLHRLYAVLSHPVVLISLGILQLYLLYYDYFVTPFTYRLPITISILAYFSFIVGLVAAHHRPAILALGHRFWFILLPLTVFLAWYIFAEGQTRFLATGNYLTFYSQWRPSTLLYTFTLFILLYSLLTRLYLPTWIQILSKLSFFVFFVHVIILELVWSFIGPNYAAPGFNLIFYTLVLGLSFALAYLAHKIPKLSSLTG